MIPDSLTKLTEPSSLLLRLKPCEAGGSVLTARRTVPGKLFTREEDVSTSSQSQDDSGGGR
jgi:hypothetical protein